MKRFLIEYRQSGGCDYTIGCGLSTEIIEAESIEDAVDMYEEFVMSNDPYNSQVEFNLTVIGDSFDSIADGVTIYELGEKTLELDVDLLRKKYKKLQEDQRKNLTRDKELAELNRLQAKYSNYKYE